MCLLSIPRLKQGYKFKASLTYTARPWLKKGSLLKELSKMDLSKSVYKMSAHHFQQHSTSE